MLSYLKEKIFTTHKNKYWKLNRNPENIPELMEKMAGDFPEYTYFGFLEKFTANKPKLKKELINQSYFIDIGTDSKGKEHYLLGSAGIQWVNAKKTLESTLKIEKMTLWLSIFTFAILILTLILLFC